VKKKSIFLQIIIGVAIIAFILNRLNMDEVISILGDTSPLYFAAACLSYFCLNIILATRFRYLLKKIGVNLNFSTVFFAHMGGMIVGDVTPGRSGYFLAPPILKKETGTRIADSMACIVAPQGIEFILKVGGAVAALFYVAEISNINSSMIISVGIGIVILLIAGSLMLLISWHDEDISMNLLNKLPFLKTITENLPFFKEKSGVIKDSINVILLL